MIYTEVRESDGQKFHISVKCSYKKIKLATANRLHVSIPVSQRYEHTLWVTKNSRPIGATPVGSRGIVNTAKVTPQCPHLVWTRGKIGSLYVIPCRGRKSLGSLAPVPLS